MSPDAATVPAKVAPPAPSNDNSTLFESVSFTILKPSELPKHILYVSCPDLINL